jgi:Raf kinase inhibitor-like YbhB/YbcL family protein
LGRCSPGGAGIDRPLDRQPSDSDEPPPTTQLPAGAGDAGGKGLPAGASQGNTDFGTAGYGGPCPPKGDKPHHYHFTVYALDVEHLDIPAGVTAANVGFNLHFHTLAKAELVALFGR